jgi:hypothetical protein
MRLTNLEFFHGRLEFLIGLLEVEVGFEGDLWGLLGLDNSSLSRLLVSISVRTSFSIVSVSIGCIVSLVVTTVWSATSSVTSTISLILIHRLAVIGRTSAEVVLP